MRINLTDERKRLLISIGSALVIHIVILILAGTGGMNLDYAPEFGPLTVEVNFDRPKPPEPEPVDVESFDEADSPRVDVVEPEIQPTPPAPTPAPATQPKPQPSAAAAPAYTVPKTDQAAIDSDIIANIKRQTSGNNAGLDAKSVFGDTRTPSTTQSSTAVAASSATSGSDVILSEAVAETQAPAAAVQTPQQTSILDDAQLASLDKSLSSGTSGGSPSVTSTDSTGSAPITGPASGNSPNVVFRDPKVNRTLLKWGEPVIPDEARTEGRSQYVVKIEFDISPNGITSNFKILEGSGNTKLDAAVQAALRNWTFASDLSMEKNVRAVLTYVIEIK